MSFKWLTGSAFCLSAAFTPMVNAAPIVDQSQTFFNIGLATEPLGQSFTAGLSGLLAEFDISINGGGSFNVDTVTYKIFAGNGTGGTLLGTGTSATSFAGLFSGVNYAAVNLLSLGVNVVAGNQYTFQLLSASGGDLDTQGVLGCFPNSCYAGGSFFSNNYGNQPNWDMAFRTLVQQAPEPASLALLGLGLAGLGFSRRKKQIAA